ncbi:MAG: hypothetical protein ACTH1Z_02395 [Ancrocorticia sp.]|uniref:hypothetical protein n=1 Tax=Ancrocorticia sp. TaxID=2593684 RepID=UPI003F912733
MNSAVVLFILAGVGFVLALGGLGVFILVMIRRSRPGRAPQPADGTGIRGEIRMAIITVAPRIPGLRTEEGDRRRAAAHIARTQGLQFPIDPPVAVLLVDPGGSGRRPRWRLE